MASAAPALISLGGSLLGGIAGGKGASKAAKIQAAAYQQGINEQQREFGITQQNEAPYIQAGDKGLASLMDLLGIGSGGATAQGSAIDALKASPLFTSQYGTGQDTILANAAATGGLRGGNTQNSLANFGSSLLSSVIQNQLGQYGNLVGYGQAATAGQAAAGQHEADSVSQLLGQQGSANAFGAAAPYGALQGALSNINSTFGVGGTYKW